MIPADAPAALDSPEAMLGLDSQAADRLLDFLEAHVPAHPPVTPVAAPGAQSAIVLGDTHGDWRSTLAAAKRFLAAPGEQCLVGLGDYVDRAPADCGEGSVANSLFLLGLAARWPERVYLLLGNHEGDRVIPVLPHDLPEEVDQLWGPDPDRYARLVSLLERGPLAARTPSGVYLAHAGFPLLGDPKDWKRPYAERSFDLYADVLWRECGASRIQRGVSRPFTENELVAFLDSAGCNVFLRGHDPDLSGRSVFHNRCLTLNTSRIYERFGGVVMARVPLQSPISSTREVQVEHLETEGRVFPVPGEPDSE